MVSGSKSKDIGIILIWCYLQICQFYDEKFIIFLLVLLSIKRYHFNDNGIQGKDFALKLQAMNLSNIYNLSFEKFLRINL